MTSENPTCPWGPAEFELLLNHQFWCFGRDVKCPAGNLLLECGFLRQPPPRSDWFSAYTRQWPDRRLLLRGFGLFYGDDRLGGLLLKRSSGRVFLTLKPRLARVPWQVAQLPPHHQPTSEADQRRARALFLAVAQWMLDYEDFVTQRCGDDYRPGSLQEWNQATLTAEQLCDGWRRARDGWPEGTAGPLSHSVDASSPLLNPHHQARAVASSKPVPRVND